MSGFQDIKVTGVVKDKTQKLVDYDCEVHFLLSATPPEEWVRMFDAHTDLHTGYSRIIRTKYHWRRIKIEGNYLIMRVADMNSLQERHGELKDAISYTNKWYKEDLPFQHIKDPEARRIAKEKWREEQDKQSWNQKIDDLDFS